MPLLKMSLEDTKHSPFQRQRNILYLISQYLSDFGLKQTKATLWNEASLSPDCRICDNIDLDTIYLDFCSYYHMRFNKLPKILKRTDNESHDSAPTKGKVNRVRCNENITKPSDDSQRKLNKETSNCSSEGLVITSSLSNSNDSHSDGRNSETSGVTKNRRTLESFDDFPGEMRDLAYVIERQIVRRDNNIKWSDIQGNEHAKQILNESAILPLKFPQLFTELTRPWKGILLHGVSGVGKTLLAKALNSETFGTVTFFNISASTMISKWRGESEKFAKVLFTMAKSCAPSIVFIDEFESLASRRDSADHEATKRFKNELLIQIDDLECNSGNVLLLANSNLPWEIDEAFLRRFERKILVDLPNGDSRVRIIHHLQPTTKRWPNNQMRELIEITEGFTGADLKISCKEASMIQIRNKLKTNQKSIHGIPEITFDDLISSIKHIKPAMIASAAKHRHWHSKYGYQTT